MMPKYWTPDIVIYHSPCMDGLVAAWAIWERYGDTPQYFPTNYGAPPPDVAGKHVLIVDFSYKRPVIEQMADSAASIIILDHHKSAELDLQGLAPRVAHPLHFHYSNAASIVASQPGQPVVAVFDMKQSGAGLAWSFAHIKTKHLLVALVEDRDLWLFKIPESKMFNLYLKSIEALHGDPIAAFQALRVLRYELQNQELRERIFGTSTALQHLWDGMVTAIADRAYEHPLFGLDVPQVNCPPEFASDVCHLLLDRNPAAPFVAAWNAGDGTTYFSLRSEDHRQDVSILAASAGGGGHRNAAGYRIDHDPL